MNQYTDNQAKLATQAECDKRNKHKSKHLPAHWIPVWDSVKGWHPKLVPHKAAQLSHKKIHKGAVA